jgi:hypothetical protein
MLISEHPCQTIPDLSKRLSGLQTALLSVRIAQQGPHTSAMADTNGHAATSASVTGVSSSNPVRARIFVHVFDVAL